MKLHISVTLRSTNRLMFALACLCVCMIPARRSSSDSPMPLSNLQIAAKIPLPYEDSQYVWIDRSTILFWHLGYEFRTSFYKLNVKTGAIAIVNSLSGKREAFPASVCISGSTARWITGGYHEKRMTRWNMLDDTVEDKDLPEIESISEPIAYRNGNGLPMMAILVSGSGGQFVTTLAASDSDFYSKIRVTPASETARVLERYILLTGTPRANIILGTSRDKPRDVMQVVDMNLTGGQLHATIYKTTMPSNHLCNSEIVYKNRIVWLTDVATEARPGFITSDVYLWISDLKGQNLRAIKRTILSAPVPKTWPVRGVWARDLSAVPGENAVSFLYGQNLYKVPLKGLL